MSAPDISNEQKIETFLRKYTWLLYLVTILTAALLYVGIYFSMLLFKEGYYWSLVLSGLLAHSFFVITMHDGAHRSITGTAFDYTIMNFCAGLIVLPLYTELFKKYHLLHHAHTNTENDPLWNGMKEKLFNEKRGLYAVLQCLPFVFNLYVIINGKREKKAGQKGGVNYFQVLLSLVVAAVVVITAKPGIWFVLGTFTVMTTLGAIRYWGEHMGTLDGKESNTHWFPLGMGIGNHDVHHHHTNYSWLTLTIGLLFRKLDTNPFKSLWGIFFDKKFHHYKKREKEPA
ncbi:MAG: fatty acid desaturase [Bacteroidetes bacterium]|nr:fatty acid desaturase [Bacteroidota bacterium]